MMEKDECLKSGKRKKDQYPIEDTPIENRERMASGENPSSGSSEVTTRKPKKKSKALSLPDDGYQWHKYGQKSIAELDCVRTYHKCRYKEQGCPAKKIVDRNKNEPTKLRVTYENLHNHGAGASPSAGPNFSSPNLLAPPMNTSLRLEATQEPPPNGMLSEGLSFTQAPPASLAHLPSSLEFEDIPHVLGAQPAYSVNENLEEWKHVQTYPQVGDKVPFTDPHPTIPPYSSIDAPLVGNPDAEFPFRFLGGSDTWKPSDFWTDDFDLDTDKPLSKKE